MVRNIRAALVLCAAVGCSPAGSRTATDSGAVADASVEVAPLVQVTVDPALASSRSLKATAWGPRPLATVRDPKGVTESFVANELIVTTDSPDVLEAFLARTGGVVIGSDAVPAEQARLGSHAATATQATEYLVKVDPTTVDASRFEVDATKLGVSGSVAVSSDDGRRLLALMLHERVGGAPVQANFMFTSSSPGDTVLLKTKEGGSPTLDALSFRAFKDANVTRVWQFLRARGVPRRVRLAIIDGGFWLDGQGHPMLDANGRADFPTDLLQFDFDSQTPFAGGPNANSCTGGNACAWHGTGAASVALGLLDNLSQAAGSGGQVADPVLLKVDGSAFQARAAVKMATALDADVVSMSFSGCGSVFCTIGYAAIDYFGAFSQALKAGVVLVASAGNDGAEADVYPCKLGDVICVGALADGKHTAIWYSNSGPQVDVWAPTNVNALYGAPANAPPMLTTFGGTSASTPLVAGVAAVLKAFNPALTSSEVSAILRKTAVTGSTDPKVDAELDAFAAVLSVSGNFLPKDAFEPNDTAAQASPLLLGDTFDLTLSTNADADFFALTPNDYTKVVLNFSSPDALGQLMLPSGLTVASGCGQTVQPQEVVTANSRRLEVLVPPTRSLLQVRAGARVPYNMNVSVTASPLQADLFEPNETQAGAWFIGQGSLSATLLNGDVDVYSFWGNSTANKPMMFSVSSADMPVTLELLAADGTVLVTRSSSSDCGTLPTVGLPEGSGSYFVRITSQGTGRYEAKLGVAVIPPPPLETIFAQLGLWWLELGDPAPRTLTGLVDGYLVAKNVDLTGLELSGQGVHAVVYALDGQVVAEGTPTVDARGQVVESVSFARLQDNASYAVAVKRVGDSLDGSARLPALPYGLRVSTR